MGACFGKRKKFSPNGSEPIYHHRANLEICLPVVTSDVKDADDMKTLHSCHSQQIFVKMIEVATNSVASQIEVISTNYKSLMSISENDSAFQDDNIDNSSLGSFSNSSDIITEPIHFLDVHTSTAELGERSNWHQYNYREQHYSSKDGSSSRINLFSNSEFTETETICNPYIGIVSPHCYFSDEKEQEVDSTQCQKETESPDSIFEIPFPFLNTDLIRIGISGIRIGIPNLIEAQIGPSSSFSVFGNKLL